MWVKDRQQLILEILNREKFSSVDKLCSIMNMSPATIRRDITKMSKLGLINKIRGGAESLNCREIKFKASTHSYSLPKSKNDNDQNNLKKIAKAAATLCGNTESVIINGGEITNLMSEYLMDKQLNIMTNSMQLLQNLLESYNTIILPAGEIIEPYKIITCDFQDNINSSPDYYYSKIFVSAHAISKQGVMVFDKCIAKANYDFKQKAEKLIVMAESSVLAMTSKFVFSRLDEVDVLITDDGADNNLLQEYKNQGIDVIVAE